MRYLTTTSPLPNGFYCSPHCSLLHVFCIPKTRTYCYLIRRCNISCVPMIIQCEAAVKIFCNKRFSNPRRKLNCQITCFLTYKTTPFSESFENFEFQTHHCSPFPVVAIREPHPLIFLFLTRTPPLSSNP